MQRSTPFISPSFVFKEKADEAAQFYCSIFPDSEIVHVSRAAKDEPGAKEGTVRAVSFRLRGQYFVAANGGPMFEFSYGLSLMVSCETQQEIDRYYERLSEGGEKQDCGWVKDKYGCSWQVVPRQLATWMDDPDSARSDRVMAAVLKMHKIDVAALERAYRGA